MALSGMISKWCPVTVVNCKSVDGVYWETISVAGVAETGQISGLSVSECGTMMVLVSAATFRVTVCALPSCEVLAQLDSISTGIKVLALSFVVECLLCKSLLAFSGMACDLATLPS